MNKIIFEFKTRNVTSFEQLLENLLKTESLDQVIEILSGIKNRTVFVKIINELLNILYDKNNEIDHLKKRTKKNKEEEEIEII